MASGSRPVKDITKEFTIAANQLQSGELIKDDFFTLFEAVGALEIMDPKMDSGFIPPDEETGLDLFPTRKFSESEALWIMDELLCLEITWLDGYPLSQTVFTSLHIDRLLSPDTGKDELWQGGANPILAWEKKDLLVDNVLLAYSIAVVKSCQLASFLVQSQTYYEEEDFVTHLFGRELLPEVGSNAAMGLMNDTTLWVRQHLGSNEIAQALIERCHLRLLLLQTLAGNLQGWEEISSSLDQVKGKHELSKTVPDAFSEKVQRRLATSTPPRPMIQISFDEAHRKWKTLCEDSISAYRITPLEVIQSPHCLQRAVWAFAQSKHPSTLARAQMQELLFADNSVCGLTTHLDLLLTDIKDLVLTGDPLIDPESFMVELPTDPRHICSSIIRDFMEKVLDEYLNLYRMACQNHCRTRRLFSQAIAIWDAIQQEADRVDGELLKHSKSFANRAFLKTRGPILTWASYHTLNIMEWTIQLGFETDIYLPDELGKMYWHLAGFSTQRSLLLASTVKVVRERKRNLRPSVDNRKAAECTASQRFLSSLLDSSQATKYLSSALWKFFNLLTRLQILRPLTRDFATPKLLYEARMKPFLTLPNGYVSELLPGPGEYEASIAALETRDYLRDFDITCTEIENDVKETKTFLAKLKGDYSPRQAKCIGTEVEWKKELKMMETTCVALSVGMGQLRRFRGQCGDEKEMREVVEVRFERKYHAWWVLPVLREREGKRVQCHEDVCFDT